MKEIWKDIKGYEGVYQISNLGRVKSLHYNRELIMAQNLKRNGYYQNGFIWKYESEVVSSANRT